MQNRRYGHPLPRPARPASIMEVPTLQTQAAATIHLIGGEKGGVGKSLVARLLAQYFIDRELPFIAYDTDRSHGALLRFYGSYSSPLPVDRFESLDQLIEGAIEQPERCVLVDLAAQTHDPLLRWMDESAVLDLADLSGITLRYWHVMDAGRDSVNLLQRLIDRFGPRLRYVLVLNELRGDDFSLLRQSGLLDRATALGAKTVHLKRLHDAVMQKIDARDASFSSAAQVAGPDGPGLGLMERQRLKLWLSRAYGQFAKAEV